MLLLPLDGFLVHSSTEPLSTYNFQNLVVVIFVKTDNKQGFQQLILILSLYFFSTGMSCWILLSYQRSTAKAL